MNNSAALDDHTAFFNGFAEDFLTGRVRDVEVRPLSFDDISALASGSAPQTFEAFRVDKAGALTPVVVTVAYFRDTPHVRTTFAMNPGTGRLDRSAPVGARLRIAFKDAYGRSSDNHYLFTTEEAEKESGFGLERDPGLTRESIFLPADSVFDHGGDGDDIYRATQVGRRPLAAVHGSEVLMSCVIAGIAPGDLEQRIRDLVEAEFGQAVGAILSVTTRAVSPDRVDVFDAETGKPVAVNVLAAEASYLAGKTESGLIETRAVAHGGGLIVGR